MLKVPQRRRRSENGAADAGKVGNDLQQECRGTTCNNTHTASAYELVGLVPVLDLANHACHTDCHHSIDQHSSTFNLFQASGDSIQHSRGEYRAAAAAAGNEVMITYGEKSNRCDIHHPMHPSVSIILHASLDHCATGLLLGCLKFCCAC